MGRPSKLTPERKAKLVDLIRGGNYIETACILAGIDKGTHYNWINRATVELRRLEEHQDPETGELPDPAETEAPYLDYFHAIAEARAHAEARNVAVVQRAASGYDVKRTRTFRNEKGEIIKIEETTWREHDPRLALEFLERSFPDRWKRTSAHEVSGPRGEPVQVAASVQYIMPDNGRDPHVGRRAGEQPERKGGEQ